MYYLSFISIQVKAGYLCYQETKLSLVIDPFALALRLCGHSWSLDFVLNLVGAKVPVGRIKTVFIWEERPGDILGVGGESGVKCISGSDLSPVSNGGKQINEKIKLVHSKELLN